VILAYAGAALLFARFLEAHSLTPWRPHALVTSAEVLEPADRALVERVFGCPVFNRYGCREVSVIASECPEHSGLHTMGEGLYVEVVRDGRPAAPGELGTILITDLLNHAMPLIRYRIGDLGIWEEGDCPCGRGLPRLRRVAGRVTDFLVGSDGRLVSGIFLATYVVGQRPSLGQVQIQQEKAGQVLYRIKPGPGFDPATDLDYLRRASEEYLGAGAIVDWQFVNELRAAPSGKFLFCQSRAVPNYLAAPQPAQTS
jgi:phenylacetate-CoA ligase